MVSYEPILIMSQMFVLRSVYLWFSTDQCYQYTTRGLIQYKDAVVPLKKIQL